MSTLVDTPKVFQHGRADLCRVALLPAEEEISSCTIWLLILGIFLKDSFTFTSYITVYFLA